MSMKKTFAGLFLVGSLAASTAIAQNNNTGQIEVKGVVPGVWEVSVYDINGGYDFDLTDTTSDLTNRVGTIHVFSNNAASVNGHLFIESANAGRLINSSTGPGIAAENQPYLFTLLDNQLSTNGLTVNADSTLPVDHNLIVPATIDFDAGDGSGTAIEGTYDISILIPGTQRPQASGVYTDTITFTIMDDG